MGVVAEYAKKNGLWQEIGQSTPPPPPPPDGVVYYGSNIGLAGTANNLISQLNPNVIRAYESNDNATTWNQCSGSQVPANVGVSQTVKISPVKLANGASGYAATRDKWRAVLAGAKTDQVVWFGVWHEPWDNMTDGGGSPGTFSSTQWIQAQVNFYDDVISYVNANDRPANNPILFSACLEGDAFEDNIISGGQSEADILYNNDVLSRLDGVDLDTYQTNDLAEISLWLQNNAPGKQWSCWEFGFNVNTPDVTATDVYKRMQAWIEGDPDGRFNVTGSTAKLNTNPPIPFPGFNGLSNPPTCISWFNANDQNNVPRHNGITEGRNPEAVAYLKSKCDGAPACVPGTFVYP